MYNARLLYNKRTGEIVRIQTLSGGDPLPIEDETRLLTQDGFIDADVLSYFEWDNPDNELETIMADGKIVKVDISQTPHVIYGEDAPEPPEPSDDDEISGAEFLNMIEGVM